MIITPEDLPVIREKHKDQKIVFCSGTFDLPHVGHLLFFEDCKKQGDILVVAIGKDANIKDYKGDKRPIMNEHIRLKMVDGMKPVDYALLDTYDAPKDDPLFLINYLIEKLKPEVYVINNDAFNISYRQEMTKRNNIKLVILERNCPPEFDNISTTKLIEKIKSS
ncbi:MAG: adenylyltransferase/cytidyltransferase family protein [Nanoarchaeota archaeon]